MQGPGDARGVLGRLALVLLVASALSCASSRGLRPLSETLPLGLPTAAVRAAWERIDGDYDTGTEHVRYALFVDPARPLLFRITQYRVSRRIAGADGRRRLQEDAETVIWNETPDTPVPLRCFAEERVSPPARADSASWRNVSPTTVEFLESMGRALQIYTRVRREGRGGPPVG